MTYTNNEDAWLKMVNPEWRTERKPEVSVFRWNDRFPSGGISPETIAKLSCKCGCGHPVCSESPGVYIGKPWRTDIRPVDSDLYWPDKPLNEITVGEFRELVEGDVIKEIIRLAIESPGAAIRKPWHTDIGDLPK
jgi:hypothetical protein